jgi:imidazolonepropionase-like amidohydrolase
MTAEGIANAVRAGADSIEHGWGADRAALELIKAHGAVLVPTTWAGVRRVSNPPPAVRASMEAREARLRAMLKQARELGVPIAAGSDGSDAADHGKNAEEMITLAELGLPPAEALRAGTTVAAALVGAKSLASLEEGKAADVIAVEGNPLEDLTALRRVRFVMARGSVILAP